MHRTIKSVPTRHSEIDFLKRKILLKRQAILLIKNEIKDDQFELALLVLKSWLEDQRGGTFDPLLSRMLAILIYLLEN